MTVDEMDIRFDILYNNISSNASVPLNAYEKSVFLSQAQRDIIIELYSGRNNMGLSFESTEEARAYLYPLVKKKSLEIEETNKSNSLYPKINKYTVDRTVTKVINGKEEVDKDKSLLDVMFITYEYVNNSIPVTPVMQDNIHNVFKNPFKKPTKDRALRLDVADKIELYSSEELKSYDISYICYPHPVVLKDDDYDMGLTIDGVNLNKLDENNYWKPISSIGDLPESLHPMLVTRAVALAKQAYNQ
jgi:hypothetical protein